MIDGKTVLAVIPARGGSKGIPRKNIRNLAGKPLIAWTIEEARKSRYIDRLILSSDDSEIMAVSKKFGCQVSFVRPAELAQDDTSGTEVVLHAIDKCPGYSFVLLLQPTSPFRTVGHIDSLIETARAERANCMVSVTSPSKHPMWMFRLDKKNRLVPFCEGPPPMCRQELPAVYALNGALYFACSRWLKEKRTFLTAETRGFYMKPEASMDIDTELDFFLSECLLKREKRSPENLPPVGGD
ncbi:MAG: acylneuraminate cytidylyltransferase family protein [Deltaproteobacteria bacterium]|nr:acylneuraminate cytidylyltransferase family protein [Deltaproteobacteria bacterium]